MAYETRHALLTTGNKKKSSHDAISGSVVVGTLWRSSGISVIVTSELFLIELKIGASKIYALRSYFLADTRRLLNEDSEILYHRLG
jgi:hypothetical protein